MKPAILFLCCAAVTAGCSTLSHEELAGYNQPRVPAPLARRMERGGKLSLADVVELSHSGVRSGEIIVYLAYSNSEFDLGAGDVEKLREEGVAGDVIACMRDNPNHGGGILSLL